MQVVAAPASGGSAYIHDNCCMCSGDFFVARGGGQAFHTMLFCLVSCFDEDVPSLEVGGTHKSRNSTSDVSFLCVLCMWVMICLWGKLLFVWRGVLWGKRRDGSHKMPGAGSETES